jgi:hypothetical protein
VNFAIWAHVFGIISLVRAPTRSAPTPAFYGQPVGGKIQDGADLHSGKLAVAFRVPGLDTQKHQVNRLQLLVGEAAAKTAVALRQYNPFACAANSFTANRSCMSGSPPLNVKPPDMTLSP